MTVQEQNLVQYYEGPISIGTSLPINEFTFIDNLHVAVKVRGENTNWIYGTDYTVSGATTSIRTLTLLKAVPLGKVLAAFVEIPITQGLAPEEGGNFPAATQELTLDKLTYICQMLYSRIKRSVQVSIDSNFDGLLYDAASQAGRAIIINELGTGLTYSTDKINDIMSLVKSILTQVQTLETSAATSAQTATTAKNSILNNTGFIAVSADLLGSNTIGTVALNLTGSNTIGTVASNIANVVAAGANSLNITKVANETSIVTCALNITAIQGAAQNASNAIAAANAAANSATNAGVSQTHATIWSEGSDSEVQALGGTHSAKGWAEQSASGQVNADWNETNSASKAYILNKPTLVTTNTYTVTVDTTWQGTVAPFTKDLTINGLLATDNALVGLIQSSTYATAAKEQEEYSKLAKGITSANTLTLYADEKTTTNLSLQIKVVK